jgi:crossover junction endodeoxyribonuclease RuvC
MRILGIDPGSRLLGWGIIEKSGNRIQVVEHGTIKLFHKEYRDIPVDETTPSRLREIFEKLGEVIRMHKPQIMVVEKVFFAKNAVSALKLGQARGVVMLTGAVHDLEIFEYSVTEVKNWITGHGRAEKEQVAKMLQLLLGQQDFATVDASDALALAVAHGLAERGGQAPAMSKGSSSKSGGSSLKALAEMQLRAQSRNK